ncbi:hypothetical protein VB773_14345 [Haloarculaceae archaeon H-GB2-1]|nr:hypothetical protein [Haloarculaceae archaeon H-GB1-1]MEA5387090.1 hypothetical protein [Haloarculaceae archaeon H-GB11]MEA5408633.1 hypothetical protein [Haloarculaceae archaeon H-GB2-1]
MAMSTWILIASVLAGLNVLFLGALSFVWLRNYRQFKSPLVAGLLAFGVVMLIENAAAIYFFFSMGMLYSGSLHAQQFVAVLRGLQFVALAFLTYVTMQ